MFIIPPPPLLLRLLSSLSSEELLDWRTVIVAKMVAMETRSATPKETLAPYTRAGLYLERTEADLALKLLRFMTSLKSVGNKYVTSPSSFTLRSAPVRPLKSTSALLAVSMSQPAN